MDELEEITELLDTGTPISWLSDILTEEVWEEESWGDVPVPPSLSFV